MGQSSVVGCPCTADVRDCMQKVWALKYAEEACYNGTLIIEAFRSGLEIATDNFLTLRDNNDNWDVITESLLDTDENLKEMEKLGFVCSCVMDSVKAGGYKVAPPDLWEIKLKFGNSSELLQSKNYLKDMEDKQS
ncbi:hypothetical protein F0562_003337 [Nyssa sinensis]|uniref:Uncharacterized protein n=1 Tax=Nyssa sinensis TaxID=561372 RepID=A0A5J5BVR2_9ASTE|nr:hypothetical protein F0562_003337 [Nyssa sinensis]